jgi:glycerol-1-phosphate dehydrogenase [NAD(P)+]
MTMAGTSSPASGAEHLVSHALEMMSSLDGSEDDLHGRRVGVGTILASEVYRRVLEAESPALDAENAVCTDFSFWGRYGDSVSAAYAPKAERIRSASESLARGNAWDDLRSRIQPMVRAPETTKRCLVAAGGAYRPEHIGCSAERILAALEHCHEIRSRFTILDLARMAGIMPAAAREIVDGLA